MPGWLATHMEADRRRVNVEMLRNAAPGIRHQPPEIQELYRDAVARAEGALAQAEEAHRQGESELLRLGEERRSLSARAASGYRTPFGRDGRIHPVRRWGRWIAAVIIVYGLFLILVALTADPGGAGMTVVLSVMGAAIAVVGVILGMRWTRYRRP